jgi:hypothetical protein
MYVLRESILHKLNNVRYWHRAAVAALTTLDFNRFRDL